MQRNKKLISVSGWELRENARALANDYQVDEMAVPSYTHPNPLIRSLFWGRLRAALELLKPEPTDVVWEFGSGTGVFLPTLAAYCGRVVASDMFPEPSARMVRRRDLRNVQITADAEPDESSVQPQSLNAIVALDVLEHVEDLPAVIRFFSSRLSPKGRIIVSGPTESPFYKLGRTLAGFGGKGDYHHTHISAIRDEFLSAGFVVAGEKRLPAWPIPKLFAIYDFRRS